MRSSVCPSIALWSAGSLPRNYWISARYLLAFLLTVALIYHWAVIRERIIAMRVRPGRAFHNRSGFFFSFINAESPKVHPIRHISIRYAVGHMITSIKARLLPTD